MKHYRGVLSLVAMTLFGTPTFGQAQENGPLAAPVSIELSDVVQRLKKEAPAKMHEFNGSVVTTYGKRRTNVMIDGKRYLEMGAIYLDYNNQGDVLVTILKRNTGRGTFVHLYVDGVLDKPLDGDPDGYHKMKVTIGAIINAIAKGGKMNVLLNGLENETDKLREMNKETHEQYKKAMNTLFYN